MAVCFTVLALAMGLPTPDAESDAFHMASLEVTVLLQEGKDDSACADLAKSLIDEVTDKVDSANKLIATLDDGSDCSSKGQDAVATATTNKENAEKAATEAASAASSAADTEVDFGSYSLTALTEGTCAQFWSDPSYTAAKKTAAEAGTAQTEADAKAKAAEAPLQAAQEQAAKDVKKCQCAARANYDKAYSAATDGVEADAAAYTKGKNMQCVLAGTAAADCKVGDVPKLKEITLAEGVPAEVCTTPSPTGSPTAAPTKRISSYKISANGGYACFFKDYDHHQNNKAVTLTVDECRAYASSIGIPFNAETINTPIPAWLAGGAPVMRNKQPCGCYRYLVWNGAGYGNLKNARAGDLWQVRYNAYSDAGLDKNTNIATMDGQCQAVTGGQQVCGSHDPPPTLRFSSYAVGANGGLACTTKEFVLTYEECTAYAVSIGQREPYYASIDENVYTSPRHSSMGNAPYNNPKKPCGCYRELMNSFDYPQVVPGYSRNSLYRIVYNRWDDMHQFGLKGYPGSCASATGAEQVCGKK